MAYTHRPFEARDADVIIGFVQSEEELFFANPDAAYPLTAGSFMMAIEDRFSQTVVLKDDEVVGYANFVKVRENGFCAIGDLMVHPGHRRKGVATHLVEVMMRDAFETYCARFVRVACFSHNQGAYQLLHAMGFRPGEMAQRLGPDGVPVLLVNLYHHRGKVACD